MSTNISSSTPAAPSANDLLVTWQTDGLGNISGYMPLSVAEIATADIDLTAQAANISTTTIFTPTASGLYRISAYMIVTQAATTSCVLPSLTIGWTDKDNATAQTDVLIASSTTNTLNNYQQASLIISAAASDVITYATGSYASVGTTPMQYALHIRIEEF